MLKFKRKFRRQRVKKETKRKQERKEEIACDREKGEAELKRVTRIAKIFFLKTQRKKLKISVYDCTVEDVE